VPFFFQELNTYICVENWVLFITEEEEMNSSCGKNMVDNFHLINPKTHFDIEIEGFFCEILTRKCNFLF